VFSEWVPGDHFTATRTQLLQSGLPYSTRSLPTDRRRRGAQQLAQVWHVQMILSSDAQTIHDFTGTAATR